MRAKSLINALLLTGLVAAVAVWLGERRTGMALRNRLTTRLEAQQEQRTLTAERDRLRAALLAATLERNAATMPPPATAVRPGAPPPAATFTPGEWTAATAWRNEGRATARETLSTLLWAAAGGDLATFNSVLEFDETVRAQLQAVFQELPASTRNLYATPEDLFASASAKSIPTTAAQVCWFNQSDAEHATVALMLASPDQANSTAVRAPVSADPGIPPSLVPTNAARLTVLSLHRAADGWRISVPNAAIARLAKQLRTGRN